MTERYKDKDLPIEERIEDLLSRMTLEEKAAQLKARWPDYSRMFEGAFGEMSEEEIDRIRALFSSDDINNEEATGRCAMGAGRHVPI